MFYTREQAREFHRRRQAEQSLVPQRSRGGEGSDGTALIAACEQVAGRIEGKRGACKRPAGTAERLDKNPLIAACERIAARMEAGAVKG